MPNFTSTDVINVINQQKALVEGTKLVETFTEFPSDQNKISEGIYVARIYEADRTKISNGILPNGHIYLVTDRVEMYLVTQQVNPSVNNLIALLVGLVDNPLFIDYHLREHTVDQVYVNNSERYKVILDLTKTQVI